MSTPKVHSSKSSMTTVTNVREEEESIGVLFGDESSTEGQQEFSPDRVYEHLHPLFVQLCNSVTTMEGQQMAQRDLQSALTHQLEAAPEGTEQAAGNAVFVSLPETDTRRRDKRKKPIMSPPRKKRWR